ncbi:MAG: ABC transporter ATP-binding protein [Lachnospirales bacterium]
MIEVHNIKKTFKLSKKQQKINKSSEKIKVAVDGISFNAIEGEIFALLGPNGAGKTTTLRMLSTLIKSDSGEIIVDGSSTVKEPEEVRKKIGFLTSDLKLEEIFTPNYLFDFFSKLYGVDNMTMEKRKKDLFDRFGISDFAEVKIADLSTGMRQKISIAISLVNDPKIIIFDEPTNGLDVITARAVTDFLQELRRRGKTIIISTHIFSLVEKLCDRVAIIIDGKLITCQPLEDIQNGKTLEDRFFEYYYGGDLNEK